MEASVPRIVAASKVRQNPDVVARELSPSEGGVLLHVQTAQYHGLNPVGLLIWSLLDGDRNVSEVVEAVRSHVEDAPPKLADEVLSFLNEVHQRGLVLVD